MKILVDADACPVKQIIVSIAKEMGIEVIMFIDTSHLYDDGYSLVIQVDKGRDSVDIALANKLQKGDIVVTQDYGVAAMALGKSCYAINQNGMIYDDNNIDKLLFERFLSQKNRKAGKRGINPQKRTQENNIIFEMTFKKLCTIGKQQ